MKILKTLAGVVFALALIIYFVLVLTPIEVYVLLVVLWIKPSTPLSLLLAFTIGVIFIPITLFWWAFLGGFFNRGINKVMRSLGIIFKE